MRLPLISIIRKSKSAIHEDHNLAFLAKLLDQQPVACGFSHVDATNGTLFDAVVACDRT
jgi:hypothetical protein